VRKLVVPAIGLLLAAACGAPTYPGVQPLGTVTGRVLSWPCAPVEIVGSPCPGKPVPGIEVDFARNGAQIGSTVTDSTGAYSIQLLPGAYIVTLKSVRMLQSPSHVTVSAGHVTTQDLVFDNGIR
jgi:Carboxypeptidase regulatory-like domain